MHSCSKCGAKFTRPGNLKRHLARKLPCEPVLPASMVPVDMIMDPTYCPFCRRKFSQVCNRKKHQRESCKIANTEAGRQALCEQVYRDEIIALSRDAEMTKKVHDREIAELRAAIEEIRQLQPMLQPASATGGGASATGVAATVISIPGDHNLVSNVQIFNITGGMPRGLDGTILLTPFGEETMPSRNSLKAQIEGMMSNGSMRYTLSDRNVAACRDFSQPASLSTGLEVTQSIYDHIFAIPGNTNAYTPTGGGGRLLVYAGKGRGWSSMNVERFVDEVAVIVGKAVDLVPDGEIFGPAGGPITGYDFKNGWRLLDHMGRQDTRSDCAVTHARKMLGMLRRYRKIFKRLGVRILDSEQVEALGGIEKLRTMRGSGPPGEGVSILVDVDPRDVQNHEIVMLPDDAPGAVGAASLCPVAGAGVTVVDS